LPFAAFLCEIIPVFDQSDFNGPFTFRLTAVYLHFLNRLQAKKREALGKTAIVQDASLETRENANTAQEANGARFGENAFDDLTDRQNEDFICELKLLSCVSLL
jgi:hypothetical protein